MGAAREYESGRVGSGEAGAVAPGSARLWEREAVTALVDRALDSGRAGVGSALFIVAEAGLGKTSVLNLALQQAEAGMQVGFARGEEMEATLPFGLVGQALGALDGALGQLGGTPGARAVEPLAPYHRVLRWLESSDGPLLLAVDDLHWADSDSLGLLSFLVRRLKPLPVTLIATLRPWPGAADDAGRGLADAGDATLHRLEPLSRRATQAMLADRVGRSLPEPAGKRAWDLCRGNPLLLEQVAQAVGRGERIPALGEDGSSIRSNLVLARFAGLDSLCMDVARAGSALGTRFRPEIAAEAARIPEEAVDEALGALYRAGIVVEDGDGETRFAHPLFADALYADQPAPVRRRLHARLFTILADRGFEIEACEHAVRAELFGNERAIAVCERAGRASLSAGAVMTAVGHLEAAVSLAGENPSPELMLIYISALAAAGRMEDSAAICRRLLDTSELAVRDRVEALRMLGRAEYLTGAPDHGEATLERAAAVALEHEPELAIQPLLDGSLTAWLVHGNSRALPLAARARDIAAGVSDDLHHRAAAVWGHIAMESGDATGLEATEAIRTRIEDGAERELFDPAELTWPWAPAYQYAMNAVGAERYDDAERTWKRAREVVEQAGAANAIGTVAIWLANMNLRRGQLDEALDEATRAAEFAELTPGILPYAGLARAESLVWLGRLDEAETACREAEDGAPGNWFAELWAAHVRGLQLLWRGDVTASDLLLRAEELTVSTGIGEPCHIHWGGHAVMAHLAAGRAADAIRVVAWHEACAEGLPCRWPLIVAAFGRAQIEDAAGNETGAERHYADAISLHDEVDLPLHRVEALLSYGGLLRRRGRPTDARPLLAEAVEVAERCEAGWLAATAREELRMAGGRRRRAAEDRDRLTAAELRVARLAADGQTNPEIARALHLSVNTVATHLKRVYMKLEIGSRRDLMKLDGELDETAA